MQGEIRMTKWRAAVAKVPTNDECENHTHWEGRPGGTVTSPASLGTSLISTQV
jgi:hypothetical protein